MLSRTICTTETDTHCQMIQGNFLKLRTKDWRDADIVFANSTCYDEVLMAGIGTVLALILTSLFHLMLSSDAFESHKAVAVIVY